jgi:hypothetical protein
VLPFATRTVIITSGTDIIRGAVRVRVVKGDLGTLARTSVSRPTPWRVFVAGKRTLPPDTLRPFTRDHAEFDPSCDRLRPANK